MLQKISFIFGFLFLMVADAAANDCELIANELAETRHALELQPGDIFEMGGGLALQPGDIFEMGGGLALQPGDIFEMGFNCPNSELGVLLEEHRAALISLENALLAVDGNGEVISANPYISSDTEK